MTPFREVPGEIFEMCLLFDDNFGRCCCIVLILGGTARFLVDRCTSGAGGADTNIGFGLLLTFNLSNLLITRSRRALFPQILRFFITG